MSSSPEYNRFVKGNFSLNEMVTTGNFCIYIAELFFCFIALPINIVFIVIVVRTSTLHRNLRILLISNCVADAIYAVSRYMILTPLLVAYLFNTEISSINYCWLAKSLHHWVVSVSSITFFVVVIERSLASFLYRTYESESCYQSGFILTGFQWFYALIVTVSNQIDLIGTPRIYSRLPCQIEYSTGRALAVFIVLGGMMNIFAVITFRKVVNFNRTLFRQRTFKLKSLTEGYQISENVKSISLLIPLLVIMAVSIILSSFAITINISIYLFVRERPENERSAIWTQLSGRGNEISQIFDICAILSKIAFCWGIRSHPELYKKWKTMFVASKVDPKKRCYGVSTCKVMGLDGSDLNFTAIEETQRHFDTLAESWK